MRSISNSIYQFPLALTMLLLVYSCNSKTKNHLSNASSPYLKQHADNPVNWYEWGDEALQAAKKENKPLLISIGYASCHWCHVMEKESFMDTAVARIMNDNFICIKVDREERPDIDNIYMNACQLITGGDGGWPLNAFALPDGKPFYAGTYYSRQSWMNMLEKIAIAYKEQNKKIIEQAEALTKGIADPEFSLLKNDSTAVPANKSSYQNLVDSVYKRLDLIYGGIKGSPKFPMPSALEFLLQSYNLTGEKNVLDAVTNTLTRMALGGIYDQAGGGFARYSTDSLWRIPHFEKMLYDNAQLMSVYAHAYQVTQNKLFKNVVNEIAAFVEKELTSPEGGFYSSINADTEEGEGEYYAWTYDEIKKVLDGPSFNSVTTYYNVSQEGNLPAGQAGWEKNKNILYAANTPDEFALTNNISPDNFNNLLLNAKKTLLAERNKRVKPATDDKILTAWNALMLKGYIDAYLALGDEAFLKKALSNAGFMAAKMMADDRVHRNYKDGKVTIDAFLDDYALLAKAYIRLYQATLDKHWLLLSQKLTNQAIKNFYDKRSGLFYYTAVGAENLVVRKMEVIDNAIPSSNAVMAEVLYDLSIYFENEDYGVKSSTMLKKLSGQMISGSVYFTQWCYLAGKYSHGTYEVAIMGKDAHKKNLELQRSYLPACLFMGGTDENLPLLENKMLAGKTLIYICTNKVCKLPVEETGRALQQISKQQAKVL